MESSQWDLVIYWRGGWGRMEGVRRSISVYRETCPVLHPIIADIRQGARYLTHPT